MTEPVDAQHAQPGAGLAERRRRVVTAGHTRDVAVARAGLHDADAEIRSLALSALDRCDALDDAQLTAALHDDAAEVRRRAAELAATHPAIDMLPTLADDDPTVVEVAAWACGEQVDVPDPTLDRLIALATEAAAPLVRESAAAALGAIGHERGLPAILAACTDKPHIRRRAVLALAPFEGDAVDAAIDAALDDRDWQVRQAADDLRRAEGRHDT